MVNIYVCTYLHKVISRLSKYKQVAIIAQQASMSVSIAQRAARSSTWELFKEFRNDSERLCAIRGAKEKHGRAFMPRMPKNISSSSESFACAYIKYSNSPDSIYRSLPHPYTSKCEHLSTFSQDKNGAHRRNCCRNISLWKYAINNEKT